ncbi:Tor complex Tor2 interacting protein 1 [Sarracenia purpurea var. burkii]
MERNENVPDKGGGGGGGVVGGDGGGRSGFNGKSSDAFIDRSKVRILLCDNNGRSSDEVFMLLCKCSYQVTSVRSARQVIDALNAEGPDIDIILSEVDLPMTKGLKMLKYIMRDKALQRIPVIMMSAQDEVSVVVKCLRLGAADYLVKPLRTNELLNLWTHMWRRRRMLGLADRNMLNYDFDLVASDPSDANTNSTTLFSDDTDDKSWKSANPEMCMPTRQQDEVNAVQMQILCNLAASAVEPPPTDSLYDWPDVRGTSDQAPGQFVSCPKKSELRIGESSAFFTYIKSSMPKKSNAQEFGPGDENVTRVLSIENKLNPWVGHVANDNRRCESREAAQENHSQGDDDFPRSSSIPDSLSLERSSTPPVLMDFPQQMNSKMEEFSQVHIHPINEPHPDISSFHPPTPYPYYISGVMNQVMLPQYGHIPQCPPHVPGMASFPYYPLSLCVQPGQMPISHPWLSYGGSSSSAMEGKLGKVDRREAALRKFRQKRKDRCFDKKIRYVNRKRLAERRPRERGQFVRKNGINVDLNGQPGLLDFDEDEEEYEEETQVAARDSSPDEDASICQ